MNNYYGVMADFYDDGSVKSAMITRKAKSIPKNQYRRTPKADCYIDWFETEEEALQILAEARAA